MSRTPAGRVSRALAADVALAAVFTTAAELDVWVRHTVEGPRLTNAVLLAFVAPPLVVRRHWPSAAAVATGGAVALQAAVVGKPPSGFLYWPILIVAYSLGAHAPATRRSLAALAVLASAYAYVSVSWTSNGSINVSAIPWLFAAVAPWFLGRQMRRRRERAAESAAVDRSEREREQHRLAALEAERGRMARELHDILAHSVSLMGIQAGAAERVLGHDPERARPVLQSIQQTSRDSVAELRRLLGMLRADDLDSDRAPQPRLDELGGLVQRMHDAGLPIELRIEGVVQPLSAGTELTAYRVAQEALTNVLKHSRPSQVEVMLRYSVDALRIVIENDGVVAVRNGAGHGLIGMSERVALYGGTLTVGERPGGRFQVEAQLPLGGEAG